MYYRVIKPTAFLTAHLSVGQVFAEGDLPPEHIANLLKAGVFEEHKEFPATVPAKPAPVPVPAPPAEVVEES